MTLPYELTALPLLLIGALLIGRDAMREPAPQKPATPRYLRLVDLRVAGLAKLAQPTGWNMAKGEFTYDEDAEVVARCLSTDSEEERNGLWAQWLGRPAHQVAVEHLEEDLDGLLVRIRLTYSKAEVVQGLLEATPLLTLKNRFSQLSFSTVSERGGFYHPPAKR